MSPLAGPMKDLDEKFVDNIAQFVCNVRNGKLQGSNNVAVATVDLLERIINDSLDANALELVRVVRAVGRRVVGALPHELVAHNMVRRVLRDIRDETRTTHNQVEGGGESLQRLVLAAPSRRATLGTISQDLREPLREHIAELRLELESSESSIAALAREHVHADELVLAAGGEPLVERFLRTTATRRYRLLVAPGTNHHQSASMAARLAAAGVDVTFVSNSSVFGVMSRVNKVVISVSACLAGGAALAAAGTHALTSAAKHYSVPVIALSPLYKLTPLHACDQHHFNSLASPHHALPYHQLESGVTHVFAPMYDFVPVEHITLFITSLGGSSPSYIYRLLSELYDPNDYQI